ncbi:hypothetical protein WR25_05346 [Diploscapter pachys]|uniref:Uncharacterized protein n=1 Tax=Diploscapter pachys TaxID=2018661 RepID=A0A2A2KA80_9BILA|nr:hypothetical protein WR25_05346 [Diploscapter pachys]
MEPAAKDGVERGMALVTRSGGLLWMELRQRTPNVQFGQKRHLSGGAVDSCKDPFMYGMYEIAVHVYHLWNVGGLRSDKLGRRLRHRHSNSAGECSDVAEVRIDECSAREDSNSSLSARLALLVVVFVGIDHNPGHLRTFESLPELLLSPLESDDNPGPSPGCSPSDHFHSVRVLSNLVVSE